MRFYRGLAGPWKNPTTIPTTTQTFEETTCPAPDGWTWDSSNGGFWRRLKVGETAQPAPKIPGQPCGTVEVREHCVIPGTGTDIDCKTLHTAPENTTRYRNYLSEQNARAVAITESIRASGWLTTRANAMSCTFWKGHGSVSKAEPYLAQQGFDIMTPPGVINIYGVPFAVEGLKNGRLERSLVPSPEQKFLIEWAIYVKSQAIVAALIAGHGCGKNLDVPMDHTWGTYTSQDPTTLVMSQISKTSSSVHAILDACDRGDPTTALTTYIEGFSLNPIQPTADEWDGSNGLRKYYERGGYLISQAIINSKIKVDSAASMGGFPTGIRWSLGYGLCPDASSGWWASAGIGKQFGPNDFIEGGMPISVVQGNDGDGKGWNIWLFSGRAASSQTKDDHYTISITPTDIGNANKVIGAVAKIMDAVLKLICSLAPVSQPIAQQTLLRELCVDASGKSCAKGTPGCKCTQPTTAQKDMVGVASAVMNYACGKLVETQQPIPPPPAQLPPPPPAAPTGWTMPLWLAGLLGLGAGAGAFALGKRRRVS